MSAAIVWKAEGGMLPAFLNQLREADVPMSDVRPGNNCITAVTPAADYHRLRPAARRTGTRVRMLRKRGLAFRLQPLRGRAVGLLTGCVAAACLLLFFSSRIWVVIPSGLEGKAAEKALATVAELGVAVGQPYATLHPKEISLQALQRLNSVIALTVNLDGCIAHVDMVPDNTSHPLANETALSNLVAARDGLILRTEIRQGTRMGKAGEGVTAGTLLASGATETNFGPLLGRAEGVVMARTSRTLTADIPLQQQQWRPSGEPTVTTALSFFSLSLPLSAPVNLPDAYTRQRDDDFLTVDGLPLPLGICRQQITPLKAVTVTHSPEEAEALAHRLLTLREQTELADAVIKDRTVSVQHTDEGCYLTAVYTCVENIAVEVPVTVIN